jgi:hypothetical protein
LKKTVILIKKRLEEKIMEKIYTLGYFLVAGPKPEKYKLRFDPLNILGLIILSLILSAVILISSFVAFSYFIIRELTNH